MMMQSPTSYCTGARNSDFLKTPAFTFFVANRRFVVGELNCSLQIWRENID
jgi:hypothetical protein